jgi:hypothetical protein
MRGMQLLDFTLLTPALSNKRGSLALLQLIVFIMRKSCVDSYASRDVICKTIPL